MKNYNSNGLKSLSQHINESLLNESSEFKGIKVQKPSSSERAKGEVYSVWNTKTKKIVLSKDGKISLHDLSRSSAKELAELDDDYEYNAASWLSDKGIK